MNLRERIIGGLLGVCVGDALGVPVEFLPRMLLQRNPVTGMIGHGTHHQPPGTWSDDSSLTLCLAESLSAGFNLHDIGRHFVRWLDEAHWTPHGRVFDVGQTTQWAIGNLARGVDPLHAGKSDEESNGNGSLMRTLPLAFYFAHATPMERMRHVAAVSCLTHGHPRSQLACIIYVEVAVALLHGGAPAQAVADAVRNVQQTVGTVNKTLANAWSPHFDRLAGPEFAALPSAQISSTGYVVHTLEAALWCLLRSESFKATVLQAVNLGGDSDSTGAVAGGLAGVLYGLAMIPAPWRAALAREEDVMTLAEQFADAVNKQSATHQALGAAVSHSTLPPDHAARLARAQLSLEGLSIGDALGQRFFSPHAMQLLAERAVPRSPWPYTDDTAMALSICEVLQAHGRIDQNDLAQRFAASYAQDSQRGYGGMAHRILQAIGSGTPWRDAAQRAFDGQGSMGNGGAMRAGPLGAYFADDFARAAEEARLSAQVTHAHPDGQAGAIAVAVATAAAWQLRDMHNAEAAHALFAAVLQHTPDGLTRSGIIDASKLPLSSTVYTAIHGLGNGSKVVSYDTVPFALWCAAKCLHDFPQSLWTTFTGHGDIDTNGAIVGSIVVMATGADGIPSEWTAARERLPWPAQQSAQGS